MSSTTYSYSPAFAAAIAPMAQHMAAAPKLAAGDVEGRRKLLAVTFGASLAAMPAASDVTETIHTTPSKDGHKINIHQFARKGSKTSSPGPAILHIHGGGMIAMGVPDFKPILSTQASNSGIPIFSVDYRLAPESTHPTLVEDCYAGLLWLRDNAKSLDIDPARIAVMGESAGGGLAAGVTLMARDQKLSPPIAKQILIYPMLDDRNTEENPLIEPLATWSADDSKTGWGALLGDKMGKDGVDEYAAPARAKDLSGLPPTYIDVGMLDMFRKEDMIYADRLADAGVMVEFHLYPGVPHGFEALGPDLDVSKTAWANRSKAIMEV